MMAFLLTIFLRSLLVGALGIAALAVFHRRSASVRHAVAAAVLAAMLTLPFLGAGLPQRTVATVPDLALGSIPVDQVTYAGDIASETTGQPQRRTSPEGIAIAIWLSGTALLLFRVAVGFVVVGGWVRRGKPMWREAHADVLAVDGIDVPMTTWHGRHLVLLPSEWESWTEARRVTVLRHEMAHVTRRDWFTQLAARFACALFWVNPAVWILERQLRLLAEQAADDLVLSSGVEPSRYAQDLLEIARETKAMFPVPALPMAAKADVARRIEMVLNKNNQRGAIGFAGIIAAAGLLSAIVVPISLYGIGQQAGSSGTVTVSQSGSSTSVGVISGDAVLREGNASVPAKDELEVQFKFATIGADSQSAANQAGVTPETSHIMSVDAATELFGRLASAGHNVASAIRVPSGHAALIGIGDVKGGPSAGHNFKIVPTILPNGRIRVAYTVREGGSMVTLEKSGDSNVTSGTTVTATSGTVVTSGGASSGSFTISGANSSAIFAAAATGTAQDKPGVDLGTFSIDLAPGQSAVVRPKLSPTGKNNMIVLISAKQLHPNTP